MTETEIIEKILQGDVDKFSLLLDKYQRQILAYTARLLNYNQHDAEDVTSNAFVKAFVNLAGFNQTLKFNSWLYRIAHNEAVNFIKQNSRYFTFDNQTFEAPVNFDFDKPNKEDLEKILSRLKIEDKNILVLFYLEEKSLREISQILKITENNAKVKLHNARNKAKKLVK